jgi:hypothetical protein
MHISYFLDFENLSLQVCIRKGGDGEVCWESKDNIDAGWDLMQQGIFLSAFIVISI